jgi:hypothetical protein
MKLAMKEAGPRLRLEGRGPILGTVVSSDDPGSA